MCTSNRYQRHKKKKKERKLTSKSHQKDQAQYNDKRAIFIANLVETTWLSRYPRPIGITYEQGSEFIGHEFIEYRIET